MSLIQRWNQVKWLLTCVVKYMDYESSTNRAYLQSEVRDMHTISRSSNNANNERPSIWSSTLPWRPFHHAGVEYAGSYLLKAREERWNIVEKSTWPVFVLTEAVHMELVESLWTADLPVFVAPAHGCGVIPDSKFQNQLNLNTEKLITIILTISLLPFLGFS